jgi:hypothetical protein
VGGIKSCRYCGARPYLIKQLKFSFIPSSVREWNKLENSVRNLDTPLKFKRALLNNRNEINIVPKHCMYGPPKLNVNDEFVEESLQKGTITSLPLRNG